MRHSPKWLAGVVVGVLGLAPQSLLACATCFGASDSAMAKGMNMGIFALMFVIGGVLLGTTTFFVYLAKRAAAMSQEEDLNQVPQKS